MKGSPIAWLYAFCGVMNLLAHLLESDHLANWSKPFLMPLLILYMVIETNERFGRINWLLTGALFFSWLGDVSLMLTSFDVSFLIGLAAFFVAHLFYIVVFVKSTDSAFEFRKQVIFPLVIYGGVFMVYLLPSTGELGIPVAIYALVLITMVALAWLRQGKTSNESYGYVLYGAGCFLLSDSILAVDRFALDLPYGHFFVMLTYIPAQYLIMKGILSHHHQST